MVSPLPAWPAVVLVVSGLLPLSALGGLFTDLVLAIGELPPPLLVGVAALAAFVETFFPPLPSESILLASAFAASRIGLSPVLLVLAAAGGSFASLYLLYLGGRGPLRDRIRRFIGRRFGDADRKAELYYARWGYGTLLVSRFLPGIRSPITFLAGVYGLTPGRVAVTLALACLAWNSLVIVLGWRTGRDWDGSPGGLIRAGVLAAVGLIILWALGLGLARLLARTSRPRSKRGPTPPPD